MMSNYQQELPEQFLRPITKEVMTDQVLAAVGQTYQRESITEWLRRGKRKSPLTAAILEYTILYDNILAKNLIREFLKRRPECKGGIKPDLNLCIQEKEELIKDLVIKLEEMKIHSTEVVQSQDNQSILINYMKEELSKFKEENNKLKYILDKKGLSHFINYEIGNIEQLPDLNEILLSNNFKKNFNITEAKKSDQIDINTQKLIQKPNLVHNYVSQGIDDKRAP